MKQKKRTLTDVCELWGHRALYEIPEICGGFDMYTAFSHFNLTEIYLSWK